MEGRWGKKGIKVREQVREGQRETEKKNYAEYRNISGHSAPC